MAPLDRGSTDDEGRNRMTVCRESLRIVKGRCRGTTNSSAPRTTDVIVVGSGVAGLSAAITAADSGARVVVIEKTRHLGGSTRLSIGSFSAAGTSIQARAGVYDTISEFEADLVNINGDEDQRDNPRLRRVLVENSAAAFEWLRSFGLQFFGPTPEASFSHPRMHNVVPNSRAYIHVLEAQARKRGVHIAAGVHVRRLTVGDGRVTGVEADESYAATQGVILATGDYSGSADYKGRFMSKESAVVPPINPTNTGDGFTMALDVGARCLNMDRGIEELRFGAGGGSKLISRLPVAVPAAWAMRVAFERLPRRVSSLIIRTMLTGWLSPSVGLYGEGAILVGPDGQRFCNEEDPRAAARGLAALDAGRGAYAVFDSSTADLFSKWPNYLSTFPGISYAYLDDYRRLRPDLCHVADTLPDLARSIGVPGPRLTDTVAAWSKSVSDEQDGLGRSRFGGGILRPPFHALGPLHPVVTITDGGLAIDEHCRVLDGSDQPIPGLFAVGATGQGGMLLRGHGLHISWGAVSGRIAGRFITSEISTSDDELGAGDR